MPRGNLSRLFKNASVYGFGQLLASILSLVTAPVLSYFLSQSDFGLVGLTVSIGGMLSAFYRMGLDGAANRFYYDVEHDLAARRRTIGTLNTFVLGWVVALSITQELVGPTLYPHLADGLPYHPYGRFVAYSLVASALSAIPQALWTAQENARRIVSLKLATSLLSSAVTFGLLLFTDLGVLSVLWGGVVAPTLLLGVHLRFSWGTFGFAWDRDVLIKALAFGMPMVVHLTSHWVLDAADRLMLDAYMSREAVGIYTVAYGGTASTLIAVNLSINGGYVPQFTRAQGDPTQRGFVARAVTWFVFASAVAGFSFLVLAPSAIRLFYAPAFREAATLALPLSIAPVFHALYLVWVNGIFFTKKTRMIPVFTVLAGAANVGLNALLIPRIGAMGAAWSTLFGYGLLALLNAWGCSRVTSIPFERAKILRGIAPLALVGAVAWVIDGRLEPLLELPVKLGLFLVAPFAVLGSGFVEAEERAWLEKKLAKWPRTLRVLRRVVWRNQR